MGMKSGIVVTPPGEDAAHHAAKTHQGDREPHSAFQEFSKIHDLPLLTGDPTERETDHDGEAKQHFRRDLVH
jgi:hypothetical protein